MSLLQPKFSNTLKNIEIFIMLLQTYIYIYTYIYNAHTMDASPPPPPPPLPPPSIISCILAASNRLVGECAPEIPNVLVYVAVGSASQVVKEPKHHQEWPLWLREFHERYPHVPIHVILIDPEYIHMLPQLPFMFERVVPTQCGHLSFVTPLSPSGIKRNVSVHVVPLSIDMLDSQDGSRDHFNIIALAQALEDLCATNKKVMAVMDAFSGHNLHAFSSAVDIRTPNRFLLGGEWNRNSGCSRDFSEPGTCPINVPDNTQMFMFITPNTVSKHDRSVIMSMTPGTKPKPSFAQLSLRLWIEGECKELKRVVVNELLLLLRMYFRIEKRVEIQDSRDNIQRSLERLRVHKIHNISCPDDVHRHMRRLISEIARHYAKEIPAYDIDTLIVIISSEPNPCNYANRVSAFFTQHFPQYPFE
jgi:hypothetical protein